MHPNPHDRTFRELLQIARVCDLQNNPSLPERLRTIIGMADEQKLMPTAEELASICDWSGSSSEAIQLLISRASCYVDQSKARLTEEHPEYFLPGGELHPQARAETCWRDCWNFLRVAIYATSLKVSECTDPVCIDAVRELYTLKKVKTGVATLSVRSQPLTPLNEESVRAQVVQQMSNGEIRFDVDNGYMLSKQLDWDETIVGFQGANSLMEYRARFSEKLVDGIPKTARR